MLKQNCSNPTPIFIIAGEVSGDMFAAELMSKMCNQKNYHFIGCGGLKMRQQGLIPIATDNSLLSSIGLLEAWRFLFKHFMILNKIIPNIKKYNCKHIILVDHEFFNTIVAKKIRKAFGDSVKIYFFIPPRVSMWGAKIAPIIGKLCNALFCYMQPDVKIYKQYNPNTFFFGNPLSQKLKTFIADPNFIIKHNLHKNKQYMALMPGSRKQEIKTLLPIFLQTALRLNVEKNIEFLITIAHTDLEKLIVSEINKYGLQHCVHIINDSSLEIMSHCSLGLVSAGTITLEAVMMNMYPIIAYKVSNITFNSIKKSEKLDDNTLIGLPNVFLKQRVFPEILQFEVTPENLYQEAIFFLNMSPEIRSYFMTDARERLSDTLGGIDSISKVADYLVDDIEY